MNEIEISFLDNSSVNTLADVYTTTDRESADINICGVEKKV